MKEQFARIGIHDTPEGRQILSDSLTEQAGRYDNIVKEYTNKHGTTMIVKDGLFAGPNGFLLVESSWAVTDDGLKLSSIVPKG